MPDLDGFQAAQAIRDHHPARDLPIILISARPGVESEDKAFQAGADAFIPKPFRSRKLVACIHSLRGAHSEHFIGTVPSPVQVVAVSPAAPPHLPTTTNAFLPCVLNDPLPPRPRLAPASPAPSTQLANTPVWIDLDHEGQICDASAAALVAFHWSSTPTGLRLENILTDSHELIPSLDWSELSVAMQSGFLRLLSPHNQLSASHRAYEVHVEHTPAGCRLRLLDVTDSLLTLAAHHTRS